MTSHAPTGRRRLCLRPLAPICVARRKLVASTIDSGCRDRPTVEGMIHRLRTFPRTPASESESDRTRTSDVTRDQKFKTKTETKLLSPRPRTKFRSRNCRISDCDSDPHARRLLAPICCAHGKLRADADWATFTPPGLPYSPSTAGFATTAKMAYFSRGAAA